MSIIDVHVLPLRASRHLATWIVWHTVRVSLLEDLEDEAQASSRSRSKRRS
jgi:hypothetical protein